VAFPPLQRMRPERSAFCIFFETILSLKRPLLNKDLTLVVGDFPVFSNVIVSLFGLCLLCQAFFFNLQPPTFYETFFFLSSILPFSAPGPFLVSFPSFFFFFSLSRSLFLCKNGVHSGWVWPKPSHELPAFFTYHPLPFPHPSGP